ncbi:hypothetical protein N7462_009601 [Penicillium macrosclerotiorum]|uniref:uncharacterized protein n=1 Tax=Penicillium macrosclerotiorum TaxID=303699 RepID=UPI00254992C7|nr:uncharacterized protein N7462_009601 [Penicillium macrosclerotiorum]KAJ5674162.1 hypothetical protein N7462_009601 [Penicillium macrosclerotiorum]
MGIYNLNLPRLIYALGDFDSGFFRHLQTLELRNIGRSERKASLAKLEGFENLEELSLSSTFTNHQSVYGHAPRPTRNILAPRLRVFRWDLTYLDQQHSEGLDNFGQPEEDLLRQFVREAFACGCPIQRIEIEYKPSPWESIGNASWVYPWDRMYPVSADLGIEIRYTPPSISREAFQELVN